MDLDITIRTLNVAVLGDMGVGKTNLVLRLTENRFDATQKATVGVDRAEYRLEVDGVGRKVQLWDTAGQERFRAIVSQQIKGVEGIILVYDVTKRESFENLEKFLELIRNGCPKDVRVLLVGNKIDLLSERTVREEEAQAYAKDKKLKLVEVSALENENDCVHKKINPFFEEWIRSEVEREKAKDSENIEMIRRSTISIKPPRPPEKKTCC